MVAIKKENARLRSEVSKISAGITAPHESLPVPSMRLGTAASDGALAVSSPERRAEQLRSRPLTAVSLQLRGETQRYPVVVSLKVSLAVSPHSVSPNFVSSDFYPY